VRRDRKREKCEDFGEVAFRKKLRGQEGDNRSPSRRKKKGEVSFGIMRGEEEENTTTEEGREGRTTLMITERKKEKGLNGSTAN